MTALTGGVRHYASHRPRVSARVLLAARVMLVMVAAAQAMRAQESTPGDSLVVTKAGDVRNLSPAQAARASVDLVGTITYYDAINNAMFMQDETGGIFINTSRPYEVHVGDRVEVKGRTNPSYRTDVAMNPSIRVLGRGETFQASLYRYRDLVAGAGDSKLVKIRGRVRAADAGQHANAPALHLDVAMEGGEAEIYVNASEGFHPEAMLDADVEITGVAGGAFDAKFQMTGLILYVADASMIRVTQKPPLNVLQLPLTDMNDVFQSLSVVDTSRRVRVRGTLTYYQKGYAAVLEREGKSIYVQTRQNTDLKIGDVTDALGFASNSGYAPSLREAALIRTGERAEIIPKAVTYNEALSGLHSDNLISITGHVVSQLHEVGLDTLVMNVEGHPVSAYLEGDVPVKKYFPGSLLRIQGICRVLPGNPWQAPYIFHLDLRTAADIELLSKPSWLTIQHLVILLCVLVLLAVAIAVWAMMLRRRVVQQTVRIKRSMTVAHERSRILEKITSNQPQNLILSEICESVMTLLPGTVCSYRLAPGSRLDGNGMQQGKEQAVSLFDIRLTGSNDETLGWIRVFALEGRAFSAEQEEVYTTMTELATIATRQSLLYQDLLHHSTHDALTELPNRRLCDSKLSLALYEAKLEDGRLAVIYIDVNRFKQVNDRFGHKVGDVYLREISARLLLCMRPTDTLARVGGDEFIAIAPFAADSNYADTLMSCLRASFNQDFLLESETLRGSASFGLAVYPENGSTVEDLKRHADHAMYLAKRSGAGTSDALSDLSIMTASELEAALREDKFRLSYQPQFSSEGGLTGLEALLRLEDPILGVLTPDAFIVVAERSDVIIEIGMWVLRRALQDAVRWKLHLGPEVVIAVNVSMRQLKQHDFTERVMACLREYNFPPSRLELEVVERGLASNVSEVSQQLEKLNRAGVRIALDDFGTGQSSLSVLHRLHVDTIKLDRSFVVAMDVEPRVLPVIEAISLMSRSLGKRVVVEGVEHVGPVPALIKMGNVEYQGYLLGCPTPAEEVDALIGTWRSGIKMPEAFKSARSRF